MIYRAPEYAKKFKCAASDCKDSCCIGWEIAVDAATLKIYRTQKGKLFEDIRKSLAQDKTFRLKADGRCPHLLKNGLCRIICEAGEEMLCEICREHPRFYNTLSHLCEWGISLACESAAQLILSENLPAAFCESTAEPCKEKNDEPLLTFLIAQREEMFALIAERKNDINTLLLMLEKWAYALQEYIDFSDICNEKFAFEPNIKKDKAFLSEKRFADYKNLILSLEPLSPQWRTRCERIEMPKALCAENDSFARLLTYFIYRYMVLAVEDGDVRGRIELSIFCAVWIHLLCKNEGRENMIAIAEAAKDFSKEVECSEDNIDAVQDFFSAFS